MVAASSETAPLLPADAEYEGESMSTYHLVLMVSLCSYNWFMWQLLYSTVVPMLPFYAEEYGLSVFDQGAVLASLQAGFLLGVLALNTVVSWMRISGRVLVLVGGNGYFLGPLIIALKPGLTTLLVGRALEGFGAALLVITFDSTLARKLLPSQKGRAFGVKAALGTCGLFFGPVVGAVLFKYGGLALPMAIITVFGFLGLMAYAFLVPGEWFADREEYIARGLPLRERYAHFRQETVGRVFTVLMAVQLMTFLLIGIFFMAVPTFLAEEYDVGAGALTIMWVSWDIMKMAGSLIGGWCADCSSAWLTTFGGLILQAILIKLTGDAAASTRLGSEMMRFYVFVFTAGTVLALGTTNDGFIGGPFLKLLAEVERVLGQTRYEELFSISYSVMALGMLIGNLYSGAVYRALGFSLTVYAFAWFQLIGVIFCGLAIGDQVRPIFQTAEEIKEEEERNKRNERERNGGQNNDEVASSLEEG